ncbi:MAG: hypothetical protein K9K66_02270 [Desulfarculaceae bacterium]|nr:hypothetical protein [Desulfarculaceae bacterium]MCF8070873.1 hypothetical protein [Desulfarculaceae bacterium]MCF8100461.1 hypothetical protein [Desulfarculaceae bacterium]MCF8117953.1 hypothetical protein [Desulfarculaceae bacterium]
MFAARRLAVILILALSLAAACSSVQEAYHEFDPRPKPADAAFQAVVKKYVQEGSIHRGPATELLLDVLPANWEVRQAWVNRRAEAFAWTPEQKAKDMADQKAEYAKYNTVLASAYTPDTKWNNLESNQANWRVYLVNKKGQRLQPVDVRRIKRRTAINEAIYPFWGKWSRLYLVKFPVKDKKGQPFLGPDEKSAKLILTGAPGQVTLKLLMR